jgi:hypothetical protein
MSENTAIVFDGIAMHLIGMCAPTLGTSICVVKVAAHHAHGRICFTLTETKVLCTLLYRMRKV